MASLHKHTASGSFQGYLRQLDYAIQWLSKSPIGAVIGIEVLDDVSSEAESGILLGQVKNSTSSYTPYTDGGVDLWKTLCIWAEALKNGEIPSERSSFQLITNVPIPGSLAERISEAIDDSMVKAVLVDLKAKAKKLPETSSKYGAEFVKYEDGILEGLILNTTLVVTENTFDTVAGRETLAAQLNLISDVPIESVIEGLRGWVQTQAQSAWHAGAPALLKRAAFNKQLQRLIEIHRSTRTRELAENLVPVLETASQRSQVFVKQIEILYGEEECDDVLIDAIKDYLRFSSEKTRLSNEGEITGDDFKSFEDRLAKRWDNLSQRTQLKRSTYECDEDCGKDLFLTTMDHREPLAGQQTIEYYLTRGGYHRLSGEMRVGWHPNYRLILKDFTRDD
jgi:hypothetical protein